jgi:DNA-binding MarR family transcriptional regulator
MSNRTVVTGETARSVAGACLCLHVQRAARALARHFDEIFRPLEITSGQYSLLMALHRPAPNMGDTAEFLAMDRSTLTAALKPLERRGLVRIAPDPEDRRAKRLYLTPAGNAVLSKAHVLWQQAHEAIEAGMNAPGAETVRNGLTRMVAKLEHR